MAEHTKLEIIPVYGIGDVRPGDDLAALIATAAPWLRDGDVLVVTSKVVSKAEGQLVDVPADGPAREAAREEVLAAQTARPVARRGGTRIVQTHHGFVLASAGIDASNVDRSQLVLLPKDPDASARGLRAALADRLGVRVAVIVSDTMGRPWRNGLTDVALGAAGIGALRDYRGTVDPYGNPLHITQMAVVDELAGAGELVKGKCDQVPVAVVRGYLPGADPAARTAVDKAGDGAGAVVLVRDAEHDLFSLGTAEARAAGLRAAALLPDRADQLADEAHATRPAGAGGGPADPIDQAAAVRRALAVVAGAIGPATRFVPAGTCAEIRCQIDPAGGAGDPAGLIRLGADIHRLRAALAAEGLATTLRPGTAGTVTLRLRQPPAP